MEGREKKKKKKKNGRTGVVLAHGDVIGAEGTRHAVARLELHAEDVLQHARLGRRAAALHDARTRQHILLALTGGLAAVSIQALGGAHRAEDDVVLAPRELWRQLRAKLARARHAWHHAQVVLRHRLRAGPRHEAPDGGAVLGVLVAVGCHGGEVHVERDEVCAERVDDDVAAARLEGVDVVEAELGVRGVDRPHGARLAGAWDAVNLHARVDSE